MTARIDHKGLALGACYALTHSVNLLEDAAVLYSQKRASSSFHLAVMAREELGRFNLLSKWYHDLSASESIDANKLTDYLQPHKIKLLAGQSVVPVPMTPAQLAEWKAAISQNDDTAISVISQQIHARAKKVKPHQAAALHQQRLKAQYVDLDVQTGQWSRPSEMAMAEASTLIRTVMSEIANVLIATQGAQWLHAAFASAGESKPAMGPFTHRIFVRLGEGDTKN
jgi:AbiV family abortive infection protein